MPISDYANALFLLVARGQPSVNTALSWKANLQPQLRLRIARAYLYDVGTDRIPEYLRQRFALSIAAQPPFTGCAGIAQHNLRHRRARWSPLKPAVDQPRLRRRL